MSVRADVDANVAEVPELAYHCRHKLQLGKTGGGAYGKAHADTGRAGLLKDVLQRGEIPQYCIHGAAVKVSASSTLHRDGYTNISEWH